MEGEGNVEVDEDDEDNKDEVGKRIMRMARTLKLLWKKSMIFG